VLLVSYIVLLVSAAKVINSNDLEHITIVTVKEYWMHAFEVCFIFVTKLCVFIAANYKRVAVSCVICRERFV